jgi:hypothetical protein
MSVKNEYIRFPANGSLFISMFYAGLDGVSFRSNINDTMVLKPHCIMDLSHSNDIVNDEFTNAVASRIKQYLLFDGGITANSYN